MPEVVSSEAPLQPASTISATSAASPRASRETNEEGRIPDRIAQAFPKTYALVSDKFRVDEAYNFLIVRPFDWLSRMLWKVVDVLIIDGVLNAGAFLVELAGDVLRFLQTGNVRNYALTFFLGVIGLMLLVLGLGF